MALATVTDATDAYVKDVANANDDPLGENATDQPDATTARFIQHLLVIFSNFELVAALASSISISGNTPIQPPKTIQPRKTDTNDLFPSPNPLDFLDISLGCIPVSVDAAARQIRWPNWAVLLPEIPSNTRFKTQGASL